MILARPIPHHFPFISHLRWLPCEPFMARRRRRRVMVSWNSTEILRSSGLIRVDRLTFGEDVGEWPRMALRDLQLCEFLAFPQQFLKLKLWKFINPVAKIKIIKEILMVSSCFKGSFLMYSTAMTSSGKLGYGYPPEHEHSYGKLPFVIRKSSQNGQSTLW